MIKLPRVDDKGRCYISYSQYSKWKYSKKDYIRSYFFGEKFEGNAYTDFGSKIGEALEKNDFSDFDKVELETINKITRLDEFEREIKLDLVEFYVLGYIDSNDKDLELIIDYKTGSLDKQSDYESDNYDQLAIYAAAIEQETGKLPKEARVELIERFGNAFRGEPLTLGKEVVKIPQDITPEKIEQVKKDIIKVAKEISSYYEIFNQLNSVSV